MDLSMHNFLHFLSIVTIAMCFIQKLPQIMYLIKVKSVQGLSITGLFLELTSYTVMTSYNYTNDYSLLSYMEYPILLAQQYILIYFVIKFKNSINKKSITVAIIYALLFVSFLQQIIPKYLLTFMAPMCTPISAFAKIAQLMIILRTKNAESVSILTWFISVMSNLIRLITIWMDSADPILLSNFGVSVSLSASIMSSALYFKFNPKKD